MKNFGFLFVCFICFSVYNCNPDESFVEPVEPPVEETQTTFGVFEANPNSDEIVIEGMITENTATDLSDLLIEYPNVNLVIMQDVNGATSSDAAFAAGLVVRNAALDVHVSDNSTITREAVDFMLGGINRSKGENTQIGVGEWRNSQGQVATDFDFGHEAHLPWINYYQQVGFQFQLATDFYYFSIQVVGPDEVYFLNDDEINTFNLIN